MTYPKEWAYQIKQLPDGRWSLFAGLSGISGPYDDKTEAELAMNRCIANVQFFYDEDGKPVT